MNTEPKRRPFLRQAGLAAIAAATITTPLPAAALTWPQTVSVPVSDTVRAGAEDVIFSGQIVVTGNIIVDTTFSGPKVLEILVDFRGVIGTGATTGKKYVTVAQAILHRPLVTRDPIQATFPFYTDGQFMAARTALASLAVSYVPESGISITSKLTPAAL